MRAFLKGLLSTLFLFVLPKEPIGLCIKYPLTLITLGHLIALRSRLDVLCLIPAFLFDINIDVLVAHSHLNACQDKLLATLVRLKDCRYLKISASQLFVKPAELEYLDDNSVYGSMKKFGLPFNPAEDITLLQIKMGPSRCIPQSLGAYHIPMLHTYLLIRDLPDETDALSRFFVLHEVGHSLGMEPTVASVLTKGVKGACLAIVASMAALTISWSTAAGYLMTIVAVALVMRIMARLRKKSRIINEVTADKYALSMMTKEARFELGQVKSEDVFEQDTELTMVDHYYRISSFKAQLASSSNASEGILHSEITSLMPELLLAAVNMVAWLILLGARIRPATQVFLNDFWHLIWLLVILNVLVYIHYYVRGIVMEAIVSGYIRWFDGKFQWSRLVK